MNNKISRVLSFIILFITTLNSVVPVYGLSFKNGQIITLEKDHDCISVLKIKGEDLLKGIAYIVYRDPKTGIAQPAFCVEPDKQGIGTGAGDSYDVTLSFLRDQKIWRVLYKGYIGSNYNTWNLECDDDLYYATKTAIHCLVQGIAPIDKYEIPNRIGWGENVSLEEVQRRGEKVLKTAQILYDYGINGKENYLTPDIYINKKDEPQNENINNLEYLVQQFYLTGNREISTYDVNISNFPEGTKILNTKNEETTILEDTIFKIAIPIDKITNNVDGKINIINAKAKAYPIFFAKSHSEELQSYVTYADNIENITTSMDFKLDPFKSELIITKTDEETGQSLSGVTFNVKYLDTNQDIGDFITDETGNIIIKNLRQGKIIITEKLAKEGYIINDNPIEMQLEYNKTNKIEINNSYKKGNLRIVKVDKDNNEIVIPNVEFELLDLENNIIGTYKTNNNGEINIEGIKIGQYKLKETKTLEEYNILDKEITLEVKWNETTEIKVENELKKENLKIIKVDKDNNEVKLEGVAFNILDETENVLETVITDKNGQATTKEYDIKNYKKLKVCEIKTKEGYILDQTPIIVDLEAYKTNTLIIENKKSELKVNIQKTGFSEAQNNQNIYYNFKNIQNNSNVELNNFTWVDILPTEAIRIDKILTGTWNQDLEYSVWYKTNKNEYKPIAENLNSQINNEINFNNIELEDNEYIIEYEFRFGTVKPGFSETETPILYCNVMNNLQNGQIFTNNTKISGEYLNRVIEDTDYWSTVIYNKEKNTAKLPRTGI